MSTTTELSEKPDTERPASGKPHGYRFPHRHPGTARDRGAGRGGQPLLARWTDRWLCRCRRLLRHLRFPDHVPPRQGDRPHEPGAARHVLRATGQATAARGVPGARFQHPRRLLPAALPALDGQRLGVLRRRLLLGELAARGQVGQLLRAERGREPRPALLVAVGRGAVLPVLAAAADRLLQDRQAPLGGARRRDPRRGLVRAERLLHDRLAQSGVLHHPGAGVGVRDRQPAWHWRP